MIIFRPVNEEDLPALLSLAKKSGVGITTLSKNKTILQKRLNQACDSFTTPHPQAQSGYYWFILEDPLSRQPMGISAIETSIGHVLPFYSYKITQETHTCPSRNLKFDETLLTLCTDLSGTSELCTLFLLPEFRHAGVGRFLSRVRFLFIASFPERFNHTLIAEMRGFSNASGSSPFWNALGKRFFHMSFKQADKLSLENKQCIADLMPCIPIYASLLSPAARAVIGKVHPSTQAAVQILLQEGFTAGQYIDVFDGGPTLEAKAEELRTIKNSVVLPALPDLKKPARHPLGMIANTQCAGFKATLAHYELSTNGIRLSKETSKGLGIKEGELVRFCHYPSRHHGQSEASQ